MEALISRIINKIHKKPSDVTVYNVKNYCKNFNLKEFKCGCGGKHCTGYPVVLNVQLLKKTAESP